MEIERAIRLLIEWYNKALEMDEIDNPVSFAAFMVSYEAGREADSEPTDSKRGGRR